MREGLLEKWILVYIMSYKREMRAGVQWVVAVLQVVMLDKRSYVRVAVVLQVGDTLAVVYQDRVVTLFQALFPLV